MVSPAHSFTYLGSFRINDNLSPSFEHFTDDLPQRTIEEQLIDRVEMAQLNGELTRTNYINDLLSPAEDAIELCLLSGALQFVHPNSPIPFERIPLHKIKHIVSFVNGRGAVNVLLVESFAYSPDHQRIGFVSKCHLLQIQRGIYGEGTAMVEKFCRKFQRKFEDIKARLAEQQQRR